MATTIATSMVYGVMLLALFFGATSVEAMYTSKSSVVEVTTQTKFDSLVLDNEGVTMVEFYAECTLRYVYMALRSTTRLPAHICVCMRVVVMTNVFVYA